MFLFARCLHFACENIHQGQEQINDESRVRKEINLCLAALLCDQLLPIRKSFDFTVEWFADFVLCGPIKAAKHKLISFRL